MTKSQQMAKSHKKLMMKKGGILSRYSWPVGQNRHNKWRSYLCLLILFITGKFFVFSQNQPLFIINNTTIVFTNKGDFIIKEKEIETLKSRLCFHTPGWAYSSQSNAVPSPNFPKKTSNKFEFSGEMLDSVSGNPLIYYQIVEKKDNKIYFEYTLKPLEKIKFNQIFIAFDQPIKISKGKKWSIGTEQFELPPTKKDAYIGASNSSSSQLNFGINIETPEERNWSIWDIREWGGDDFQLRLMICGEKEVSKNEELKISFSLSFREQTEIQEVKFTQIDISKFCNMGFKDEVDRDQKGGWTDQGEENDLRMFTVRGLRKMAGVEFKIIDPSQNQDKSCIVLAGPERPYFPKEVSIDLNQKTKFIYLLHASAWTKPKKVGEIKLIYTDNTESSIVVNGEEDVGDWWGAKEFENGKIGWVGENKMGVLIGLYVSKFKNPNPEKELKKMLFKSEQIWQIVAVTLSEFEVSLKSEALKEISEKGSWIKYEMKGKIKDGSALDLSFLLDPPAGKYGFLRAKDGKFYFEKGKRARFWGVNTCFMCCFPSKEDAEMIAERIAKMGHNLVRFHHFDPYWPYNKEMWDRIDYFFSQLKKRGVYITIDLFTIRQIKKEEAEKLGIDKDLYMTCHEFKIGVLIDEGMYNSWKNFAKKLLTHKNPYTGLSWKDDPALATISLLNEDCISWYYTRCPEIYEKVKVLWNKYLLEKYGSRQKLKQAWTDIEGKCSLREEEDPEKGSVGLPTNLWVSWKNSATSLQAPQRVNEAIIFLTELQRKRYLQMIEFLKNELKVKQPLSGLNAGQASWYIKRRLNLDYVDDHYYWDHPNYTNWSLPASIHNKSAVNTSPYSGWPSHIIILFLSRLYNKPFTISEWNYVFPNFYRAEGAIFASCYGAFQDWDGFMRFAYSHSDRRATWWKTGDAQGGFDICNDPTSFSSQMLGSIIYLRQDVKPGKKIIDIGVGQPEQFYAGFWPKELFVLPYLNKVRIFPFDKKYSGKGDVIISAGKNKFGDYTKAKRGIVFSQNPYSDLFNKKKGFFLTNKDVVEIKEIPENEDWLCKLYLEKLKGWKIGEKEIETNLDKGLVINETGELIWNFKEGILKVDTERTGAVVGFFKNFPIEVKNLKILDCKNNFGLIGLTTLKEENIKKSKRLLLLFVTRSTNTDLLWGGAYGRRWVKYGSQPLLVEEGDVEIEILNENAKNITVYVLDSSGERVGKIKTEVGDNKIKFRINRDVPGGFSFFYELVVE